MKKIILLFTTCLVFLASVAEARIYIPVDQPSDKQFPIAITDLIFYENFLGANKYALLIPEIISTDLILSGYFETIPQDAFLDQGTEITQDTINFAQWTAIEAGALVKGSIEKNDKEYVIKLRLFDPYSEQLVVGKQYTTDKDNIRSVAHRFTDEIMLSLTGRRGIFSTMIAYSALTYKGNKALYIMDIDGYNNRRVIKDRSINLGPSWSPEGKKLVYASYLKGNPEIFTIDLIKDEMKQLTHTDRTNITPVWHPDGDRIYFTLSLTDSTEIMSVKSNGKGMKQETNAGGINIAPRFSSDGKMMYYSSTRAGRLHVYKEPTGGGVPQRLTFVGKFNDSPDISPDGSKVVFCGQDSGNFDIFVMNSDGTNIQRLTINSGNNEHPRWSPDGRFIVFSSTRSGGSAIYMMRADGSNQARISKGNGHLPDWSPWFD